jgi:hypothetical protein
MILPIGVQHNDWIASSAPLGRLPLRALALALLGLAEHLEFPIHHARQILDITNDPSNLVSASGQHRPLAALVGGSARPAWLLRPGSHSALPKAGSGARLVLQL